jgi:hypothetical protein
MKAYKDFKPTAFDGHYPVDNREHWLLAPVARNRDSGPLERSNFRCFAGELGEESETTYEIHRFGHWGPGWFEIILINPENQEAVNKALEMESALENYPVLNEDDYCQLETEEANQIWESCYDWRGRVAYIRKHESEFDFRDMADLVSCVRGKYFAGYASELIA